AAFAVALTHGSMVFINHQITAPVWLAAAHFQGWLITLLPAGGSVVLFFVLSGYVLGNGLLRGSDFPAFAIRRIFRIFPAYVVSLFLMYAVRYALALHEAPTDTTDWFNNVYWPAPDILRVLCSAILVTTAVIPVAWSLLPEVACSMMLPLVVVLHRRTDTIGRFCLLAALAPASRDRDDVP